MKNFVVILFLASYLFSTTPLSELLKMDSLIEHYKEHSESDKSITVYHFLCMHYLGKNVKDADYERDMKLPFKTLDTCSFSSITFCTPIEEFQFSNKVFLKLYKIPSYKYNFAFSSNYHSAIWQPPKSC